MLGYMGTSPLMLTNSVVVIVSVSVSSSSSSHHHHDAAFRNNYNPVKVLDPSLTVLSNAS